MIPLAHLSYPTLLFVLFAEIFGWGYSFYHLVVVMVGSVLPDLDLFFFSLFSKKRRFSLFDFLGLVFVAVVPDLDRVVDRFIKKERFEEPFGHRFWLSHTPLLYSPLLFLFWLEPSLALGLFCFGVYSHFILDTLVGEGIRWGHPLLKKEVDLGFKRGKRVNAIDYYRKHKKSSLYKVELFAFFLLLVVLAASFSSRFLGRAFIL